MDQNNFNGQGVQNDQTREPLPTFEQPVYQQPVYQQEQPVYQQPVYQQPVYQQEQPAYQQYQQPVYQQPMYQQSVSPVSQEIEEKAGSAFGKGLAATIMAWFPITSIIAIILGSIGLKLANANNEHASRLGVSAGGKNVAAKILGIVGLVSGIVMTIFWVVYIIAIVAIVENANEVSNAVNDFYYHYY